MNTSVFVRIRRLVLTPLQEKSAAVKEHPVPELQDNDILVQVAYVAQNPTGKPTDVSTRPALTSLRLETRRVLGKAQGH